MKKNSEELLVLHKKTFFLIVAAISILGILAGYTLCYITIPVKEVYVQKTSETEKTVLPSTSESVIAKKPENVAQANQPQINTPEKKDDVKVVQEVETIEKTQSEKKIEHKKKAETKVYTSKKATSKKAAYTIQLGAFSDLSNAEALVTKLRDAGFNATLVKEKLYKVKAGYYKRFKDAKKASEFLRAKGFDNFITKTTQKLKGGSPSHA